MELSSLIDRLPSMVKVSVSVAILSFFQCKTLIQFKQSNLSFPVYQTLISHKSFDICGSFWSRINIFSFTFLYHLWNSSHCCEYITDFVQGLLHKFLGIVKYLEGIFLWSTVGSIFWFHLKALYISSPFVAWTQTYTPYILVYIANHTLSL